MERLSESEQRILSELEEFGERDIVPLINLTTDVSGAVADIDALVEALRGLLARGAIEVSLETFLPRKHEVLANEAGLHLLGDLAERLEFGKYGSYWHYRGDMRKDPRPAVLATEKGLREAREILKRRGYQWWSPKKR